MLRAVIFDFDGVITDSEMLHLRAFNSVLAPLGLEITKQDYYRDYLGLTDRDLLVLLADKGLIKTGQHQIDNLARQKKQTFEKLAATEAAVIEGVPDFLRLLHRSNIPVAICSGALRPEIEMILQKAKLSDFFEVIVSAEEIKRGKPDPEGFVLTLQKLNRSRPRPISPGECVVIEDSHWGLEAAKAARMHTLAVTNSYAANQLQIADKIVANLNELTTDDLQKLCR